MSQPKRNWIDARRKIEDREPVQGKEALATVRGHLEGYADAVACTLVIDRGQLVSSLREDAEALAALDSHRTTVEPEGEQKQMSASSPTRIDQYDKEERRAG